MCGIVGYIGKRQAAPILLEGLHRLEYRGYDSAGLAVVSENGAKFYREKGRVAALKEKIAGKDLSGSLGIAHTRWATHGVPSEKNAHPHCDCKGEVFVVHNGIIENYQAIKEQLIAEGHRFISDTDTEVLAHLIEKYYQPRKDAESNAEQRGKVGIKHRSVLKSGQHTVLSLQEAVQQALRLVTGAYGIAVVSSREPETLVAARFGSPLVLGVGQQEYIIASDLTAILPVTSQVIYLEDGEMAVVNHNHNDKDNPEPVAANGSGAGHNYNLIITDLENRHREKSCQKIDWTIDAAEKGGYEHFMLKEIFEQPQAVTNSIRGRLIPAEGAVKLGGLERANGRINQIERLVILGMGTSRNAGLVGEYMLEEYAELPVEVEFASEFAYRKPLITAESRERSRTAEGRERSRTANMAILAVSQSGETADTLMAIKEAKRKGALVLGIVNVTGSTIARETDAGVYNHIGPEIAVASTKAFLSQTVILALLSIYFGRKKEMSLVTGQRIIKEIQDLPAQIDAILDTADAIKSIAEKYKNYNHFFYLGRKYNYPVALEGALKLKEIAYVHAEGYNGGEMKHGPIALLDEQFPVMVIAPTDSVYEKNINHIKEIKARGAKVIAIATEGNEEIKKIADDVIYIPKTLEMLTPILSVVPLQLFAYYVAVARGCDVDKPRNLAKSVTVE